MQNSPARSLAVLLLLLAGALSGVGARAQVIPACPGIVTRLLDASPAPSRNGLAQVPGFMRVGDFVYFSAFRPAEGWTLWRTDSTPQGTAQVSTLSQIPGGTNSAQTLVAATSAHLYFTSNAGVYLWRTDGTSAGTQLLDTQAQGIEGGTPLGDRLIYRTSFDVRIIGPADATPTVLGPTLLVPIPNNGSNVVIINGRAIYALVGPNFLSELWSTDGTPSGTIRLAQYDGVNNADGIVSRLYRVGEKVIYRAATPATGVEFFQSDGTPAGTGVFHEFAPGPSTLFDTRAIGLSDDKLYMNALTTLAVTDGVTVTNLRSDFQVYPLTVAPDTLARAGDYTLFSALVANPSMSMPQTGREPFISDGSPANTGPLGTDFVPGSSGAFDSFTSAAQFGDRTVFVARQSDGSADLYITDGSPDGTTRLAQGGISSTTPMFADAGRLFFVRFTPGEGGELWVTDGTPQGTRLVKDIWPGASDSVPDGLYPAPAAGGTTSGIVFAANAPDAGRELWFSDGTPEGTRLVLDIAGGSVTSNLTGLGTLNSNAFFGVAPTANLGVFGTSITLPSSLQTWDGSPARGRVITDVASGDPATNLIRSVRPLFETGVGTYFVGSNPSVALFITDGTDFGTLRLTFSTGLVNATQVRYFVQQEQDATIARLGDTAVFSGVLANTGSEPAIIDGTPSGAAIILDVVPGSASSSPASFTSFASAGKVIFRATTPDAGTEPWITDGTGPGTVQLADAFPGPNSGLSSLRDPAGRFAEFNGRMYFYARTGSSGTNVAVFSTDGTPAGTAPINSGLANVVPVDANSPGVCERGALFWGNAIGTGAELYVTDNTPQGTAMVRDVTPGPASTGPLPLVSVGRFSTFVATVSGQRRVWFTDGTSAGTRPLNATFNNEVLVLVGRGVSEPAPAPAPRRTFFVGRTASSRVYVCVFTTEPEGACILAEVTPVVGSMGELPTPTLIRNRLFLPLNSVTLGAEPMVIDLCPADFNNSGGAPTVQDIFDFVTAFFVGELQADTDLSGRLDIQDIFDYLTRWFAGCGPGGAG